MESDTFCLARTRVRARLSQRTSRTRAAATRVPVRTNFLPFFSSRASSDGGASEISALQHTHPRTYHRYLFLAMMTANTRRMFRSFARFESCNAKINTPPLDRVPCRCHCRTVTVTVTVTAPVSLPSLAFYARGKSIYAAKACDRSADGSQGYGSMPMPLHAYGFVYLLPLSRDYSSGARIRFASRNVAQMLETQKHFHVLEKYFRAINKEYSRTRPSDPRHSGCAHVPRIKLY